MSATLAASKCKTPRSAAADAERRNITLVRAGIALCFIAATMLQRFGINLGVYSVSASFIAVYMLVFVSMFTLGMQIALDRLALFVVGITLALVGLLVNLNLDGFSRSTTTSMVLLIIIYLPLILVLKPRASALVRPDWALQCLSTVLMLCALAGIAQFYLQFIFRPDWLFDFSSYIPAQLRGPSGFNTAYNTGAFFKSNCFFFLEPSHASFAMALGVLLEIHCFKRAGRAAIFGLALVLTYSGTGLLALAVGLMFPFNLTTLKRLAVLAVVGVMAYVLLDDALNLSFTINRLGEFGSERSSGYIRYVAPLRLVSEQILREPWTFWLGNGAGTILRISKASFDFHDPTWAKLLIEYGTLGFITFLALYLVCLFQRHLPSSLSMSLFLFWLIMGGFLLASEHVHFAYVLSGFLACRFGPQSGQYAAFLAPASKWRFKV